MFSQSEIALHAAVFELRDCAYHDWAYAGKIYRSFREAVYGVGTVVAPLVGANCEAG